MHFSLFFVVQSMRPTAVLFNVWHAQLFLQPNLSNLQSAKEGRSALKSKFKNSTALLLGHVQDSVHRHSQCLLPLSQHNKTSNVSLVTFNFSDYELHLLANDNIHQSQTSCFILANRRHRATNNTTEILIIMYKTYCLVEHTLNKSKDFCSLILTKFLLYRQFTPFCFKPFWLQLLQYSKKYF